MIIKSLKLVNFRNYSLSNFTFDRGINFIYGDNAIGKTNLVEGIYYFSLTRSFRTNTESLLINKNASSFYLEGVFIKENKKYNINISLASNVKKIGVNGRNIKKVSDLSKIVNVISFIPSDVNLLKDTPKKMMMKQKKQSNRYRKQPLFCRIIIFVTMIILSVHQQQELLEERSHLF